MVRLQLSRRRALPQLCVAWPRAESNRRYTTGCCHHAGVPQVPTRLPAAMHIGAGDLGRGRHPISGRPQWPPVPWPPVRGFARRHGVCCEWAGCRSILVPLGTRRQRRVSSPRRASTCSGPTFRVGRERWPRRSAEGALSARVRRVRSASRTQGAVAVCGAAYARTRPAVARNALFCVVQPCLVCGSCGPCMP